MMIVSKNIMPKKQGIVMRSGRRPFDRRQFFLRLQKAAVRLWERCRALLPSGGYRPELHYMRGPGPKSLNRHSSSAGDQGA
jgi:hypothetical protein